MPYNRYVQALNLCKKSIHQELPNQTANNINMIEQGGFEDSILQHYTSMDIQSTLQEVPKSNEIKHVQPHRGHEANRLLNNLNITEQEKRWQREVEAERRQDRLARETVEKRQQRLDRDRLRNWRRRQFESAEQKQDRRAKDRIRHRLKRCTKDKVAIERDRLKKQMNRQNESIEEKQERRARDRLRHQLKRWTQNRMSDDKKSSATDSSITSTLTRRVSNGFLLEASEQVAERPKGQPVPILQNWAETEENEIMI